MATQSMKTAQEICAGLNELEIPTDDWQENAYSWAAFREMIAQKVAYLIEQQPADFFNMLYRLDIEESKIYELITAQSENVYLDIADTVLEREQQKIESRRAYNTYFEQNYGQKDNSDISERW